MEENRLFELKIIEPSGMFFDGEADFIEFTTLEGKRGVYKNHLPLTAILEPCEAAIYKNGEKKKVSLTGGFIEIRKEKIVILAEAANWSEDIL